MAAGDPVVLGRGNAASGLSAELALTTLQDVAAGDKILVLASCGSNLAPVSATDSAGNVYAAGETVVNGARRYVMFRATAASPVAIGQALTVTFPSSTGVKVAVAMLVPDGGDHSASSNTMSAAGDLSPMIAIPAPSAGEGFAIVFSSIHSVLGTNTFARDPDYTVASPGDAFFSGASGTRIWVDFRRIGGADTYTAALDVSKVWTVFQETYLAPSTVVSDGLEGMLALLGVGR